MSKKMPKIALGAWSWGAGAVEIVAAAVVTKDVPLMMAVGGILAKVLKAVRENVQREYTAISDKYIEKSGEVQYEKMAV